MGRHGLLLPLLFVATAAGALVWRVWSAESREPRAPNAKATYPDFRVQTASGAIALSDLRGKVVVVYFGYTACPDICPTTLATLGAAFRKLPDPNIATALFVSVDPERDTPERLATYVQYFWPSFYGGTASLPEIRRFAEGWGVAFRKVRDEGSALNYMVDHTTQSFVVDPGGKMVRELAHGTPADAVAKAIQAAARE